MTDDGPLPGLPRIMARLLPVMTACSGRAFLMRWASFAFLIRHQ